MASHVHARHAGLLVPLFSMPPASSWEVEESATGQGWGLPVYRWEVHERDDHRRCANTRRSAELYDGCRIDHLECQLPLARALKCQRPTPTSRGEGSGRARTHAPCSFPRIDQPAAPVVCRPTGPEARVQSASVYETERGTGVALQRSMKITAEEMLSRFLVERRNAIVRRYLPAVNPVVDVRLLPSGTLTFVNAAVDADVAPAPTEHVVSWSRFDNTGAVATPIGETSAATASVAAPTDLPSATGTYIRVEIAAKGGPESWAEPAHAYFRRDASGWTLVGCERVPGGNPPGMRSASQRTN